MQEGCSLLHPIRKEPSREPSIQTKEPKTKANLEDEPKEENFRFGVVTYQRPPDEIDFADLVGDESRNGEDGVEGDRTKA